MLNLDLVTNKSSAKLFRTLEWIWCNSIQLTESEIKMIYLNSIAYAKKYNVTGSQIMTLKDWMCEWLEHYLMPTVKERTYLRYESAIKLHIIPALGGLELNEITNPMIQHLISEMLVSGNLVSGKGLSANSINTIISVLQNSFGLAYSLGYTNGNPAVNIKRPRLEEKEVTCFTVDEQRKLEKAILEKKGQRIGILLCLYSGLRIGELLALEWNDLDLKKGFLSVNKTCYYGKTDGSSYARITYAPKTKSSIRIIPLPKVILAELKELKKKAQTQFLIESKGKPISVRVYQKSFETLVRKLGIPHKSFHALRHTFATRALECGMDVKTLSEILGHKNSTVTLNRYAHSLMEHKIAMMNKLGKLLN